MIPFSNCLLCWLLSCIPGVVFTLAGLFDWVIFEGLISRLDLLSVWEVPHALWHAHSW